MKKPKSKLDYLKKNIVIIPVIGAILAGTFTSVRYVLRLAIRFSLDCVIFVWAIPIMSGWLDF